MLFYLNFPLLFQPTPLLSELEDTPFDSPPDRVHSTFPKTPVGRRGGKKPFKPPDSSSAVSDVGGIRVNVKKLKAILKGYGEYPSKYRYSTCTYTVCTHIESYCTHRFIIMYIVHYTVDVFIGSNKFKV